MSHAEPLWTPTAERKAGANLMAFTSHLAKAGDQGPFQTYADIHCFSVEQPDGQSDDNRT